MTTTTLTTTRNVNFNDMTVYDMRLETPEERLTALNEALPFILNAPINSTVQTQLLNFLFHWSKDIENNTRDGLAV